jgi:hypothetical protein
MLVGVFAGLLAFGFARIFGEPQVDRAIAFEDQMNQAKGEAPEPELVTRETQAGLGLFTGVIMVASAASELAPPQRSSRWAASLRSCSSPTLNIRQIRLRSEILRRSGFERNYSLCCS